MSRASEYAERVKAALERPVFRSRGTGESYFAAEATPKGHLSVDGRDAALSADDALAFAAWIQETFGEPQVLVPLTSGVEVEP